MKINFNNLEHHLFSNLQPIYIVSGDEPFQVQQAIQMIRDKALKLDYSNRELLFVEKGFSWHNFSMSNDSMSLFAEKKIIELRMPNGKPGKEGGKILQEYCDTLSTDTLLLIVTNKLEKATTQTKWYKSISSAGAAVTIWPIEGNELRSWVSSRLKLRNLTATNDALLLIIDRVEGNLLAADQEIEKLALISCSGEISLDDVEQAVADSARYDLFKLVDAALSAELQHITRILYGLKAEGVTPILVNWALSREIRSLLKMKTSMDKGNSVDQIFRQNGVWDKRKPLLRNALASHSVVSLQALLRKANKCDRIIKGSEIGNLWDELLQLSLGIAGLRYLPAVAVV
ncbi:DNA polymerase III delta subunit [hydrothermal vent metagenome]|uniref:DNA polymerase III subunit delta n=1 Tax=hydrothermal vent metagenome TaxID=652676 RepID=A0A3B1AM60_9ZZZZ